MIAFRAAAELDLFRPSIVRIHELPAEVSATHYFAPAMSFPQYITVQQAIEALRELRSESDSIYYLFVTDSEEHLVGVISLHHLVTSAPDVRLFEIMDRRVLTLSPDATLEEQAHILSESGLLALPVVDEKGRLVGAMDAGDLIAAVQKEATGDLHHLAGLSRSEDTRQPIMRAAGARAFWLGLSLAMALLVTWVLGAFVHVLAHAAVLVVLLPLVVWPVSRAGVQTCTFLVRSLSLGQLNLSDTRRVIKREVLMGLVNGLAIGLLAGLIGWIWQGSVVLGLIVSVAVLVSLALAALLGTLVPLGMKALRIGPVHASVLIVTTISSMIGIALELGLGSLALQMGYML